MPSDLDAPGPRLLRLWSRLAPWPGGSTLFSLLLGRMVPYTGKLGARVQELEPGLARVTLADRRRVRNHLASVHAVALTNLGELASGLALLTALPADARGIVTRLETTYHHKARGRLEARAAWSPPELLTLPGEARTRARIMDAAGQVVATVDATWRLGAKA